MKNCIEIAPLFIEYEEFFKYFTKKGGMATAEFSLNPDDEDTKSHIGEIKNNLKGLGLKEGK